MTKGSHFIIWRTSFLAAQKIKGMVFTILLSIMTFSFQISGKGPEATLSIYFRAYVHGEPLQLNKKYKNPFGETFEISRFRFYAGKIEPVYSDAALNTSDFTLYHVNSSAAYHLIDFSDSASTRIELPVTAGVCNGIQFQLGIDSIDQSQGAQTGALDPAKGMFWTWNSGYQSFKIEGFSPVSSQPAHLIAYHIGGYRYPYNTVWKIKLNTTNNEVFRLTKGKKSTIEIPLDLDYLFDGPTPLFIKENPACTTAGELARKVSENFIGTFTGLTLNPDP